MVVKQKLRVFVGMSGGFGPLSQVLPIIETFEKEEFDITCYIASSSASMVKMLGYKFLEAPFIPPPQKLIPKGYHWWDIDYYWGKFGYIDQAYLDEMIPAKVEQIRKCKPDFIISQFSPPTEIAAKVLGVPLISVTQSCMHPKGKRVSWWREPEEEYPRATNFVNKVTERFGLKPIEKMEDLNKGDLTIIPSFPEFDPIDDNVIYIGPLLWESSGSRRGFNADEAGTHDRPLILVYTGNLYDSAGPSGFTILQNVIHAFGGKNIDVIVSTGLEQSLENVVEVPNNIQIVDWVPAAKLIKKCHLTIHHGGHGSCMLNIINGVPAIIIPTFSEREFNARQFNELGVGNFIPLNELNGKSLYAEAERIICDKAYTIKASEWAEVLKKRNYGGGIEAKRHIMETLRV